jgi:hypothetical protein
VCVQEAGTSRGGGGSGKPSGAPNVERSRTSSGTFLSPHPGPSTSRTPSIIVLKDGDPIPEGYKYVVQGPTETVPSGRSTLRNVTETVDLTTPPKAVVATEGEEGDASKLDSKKKRNLRRNACRKANTTYAKEMKESLASGRPTVMKVTEEQKDLKSIWHAAAKEIAYKLLDLRKETWKDYTPFEKALVHNELNAQFKFDPPLDPKTIDKFLSGHLRTSRAVWKMHWKKYGPDIRHPNCPEEAWAKLVLKWPTDRCKDEAAEMANRRARVERKSTVGRSSLMAWMDATVSYIQTL